MNLLAAPLKVFIIEDETLLVMDLEFMIESSGHLPVGDAASLTEVFSHTAGGDADLYIIDMKLRDGSNGLDVARRLRERADPLIAFITANLTVLPDNLGVGDVALAKPIQERAFKDTLAFLHEGEQLGDMPDKMPVDLIISERLKSRWRFKKLHAN